MSNTIHLNVQHLCFASMAKNLNAIILEMAMGNYFLKKRRAEILSSIFLGVAYKIAMDGTASICSARHLIGLIEVQQNGHEFLLC